MCVCVYTFLMLGEKNYILANQRNHSFSCWGYVLCIARSSFIGNLNFIPNFLSRKSASKLLISSLIFQYYFLWINYKLSFTINSRFLINSAWPEFFTSSVWTCLYRRTTTISITRLKFGKKNGEKEGIFKMKNHKE